MLILGVILITLVLLGCCCRVYPLHQALASLTNLYRLSGVLLGNIAASLCSIYLSYSVLWMQMFLLPPPPFN
jgi:hypothetical protein